MERIGNCTSTAEAQRTQRDIAEAHPSLRSGRGGRGGAGGCLGFASAAGRRKRRPYQRHESGHLSAHSAPQKSAFLLRVEMVRSFVFSDLARDDCRFVYRVDFESSRRVFNDLAPASLPNLAMRRGSKAVIGSASSRRRGRGPKSDLDVENRTLKAGCKRIRLPDDFGAIERTFKTGV
jgi:hypothetical protein